MLQEAHIPIMIELAWKLDFTYMIVFFLGQRQRVVVEEPEHVVLGHRVHLGVDAGGGREEVPGHCHQGKASLLHSIRS